MAFLPMAKVLVKSALGYLSIETNQAVILF